MNFEKYGNKLDNLLYEIEKRLILKNKKDMTQIGGGDGPEPTTSEDIYSKVISYSVNHVSVLVHLYKNGSYVTEFEEPQINYKNTTQTQDIFEYSIEQQLRLGCDNKGNMYNYSIVLTRKLKIEQEQEQEQEPEPEPEPEQQQQQEQEGEQEGENKVKESLGKLGSALSELSRVVQQEVDAVDIE